MTKDMVLREIKKLQFVEQMDIAIEVLIDGLSSTGANEKLLVDELNQIRKVIANPSEYTLKEEANE